MMQIVGGGVVADEIMKALNIQEVEICPWALREGAGLCAGSTNSAAPASVSSPIEGNRQTAHHQQRRMIRALDFDHLALPGLHALIKRHVVDTGEHWHSRTVRGP